LARYSLTCRRGKAVGNSTSCLKSASVGRKQQIHCRPKHCHLYCVQGQNHHSCQAAAAAAAAAATSAAAALAAAASSSVMRTQQGTHCQVTRCRTDISRGGARVQHSLTPAGPGTATADCPGWEGLVQPSTAVSCCVLWSQSTPPNRPTPRSLSPAQRGNREVLGGL
jgi:hypothetical protein